MILKSPYRKVITPILNYIWQLEGKNPENVVAVLIPQLIESRWYYSFLHNRRAAILQNRAFAQGAKSHSHRERSVESGERTSNQSC